MARRPFRHSTLPRHRRGFCSPKERLRQLIDLSPGKRLGVTLAWDAAALTCEALILEVSEHGIRIDWPRRDNTRLELKSGDDVTISFSTDDGVHTFTCQVEDAQETPSGTVLLKHPTEVNHDERRQFFRLPPTSRLATPDTSVPKAGSWGDSICASSISAAGACSWRSNSRYGLATACA